MTPIIIDLFPSCHLFQRFLTKLYIKPYSDTLMISTYLHNARQDLEMRNQHPQGLYPSLTHAFYIWTKDYQRCVCIDLKKAFDTISHERLLAKLYLLNIRGQAPELFKNYLSNRNQMTTVNDVISDARPMTIGVPQGSILRPVLFTLYIKDIAQVLKNPKICLFADDTVIYYAHNNIEEAVGAIQQDL